MGAGLIDDFIRSILSVSFCPCHFVHTILSNAILSLYHFVHTILSVPFCPLPFCPRTNRCIVTEGGTDKNQPGQNHPDKNLREQLKYNLYRGLLSGIFVLGLLKIGGSEMCDVLSGGPGLCDKV